MPFAFVRLPLFAVVQQELAPRQKCKSPPSTCAYVYRWGARKFPDPSSKSRKHFSHSSFLYGVWRRFHARGFSSRPKVTQEKNAANVSFIMPFPGIGNTLVLCVSSMWSSLDCAGVISSLKVRKHELYVTCIAPTRVTPVSISVVRMCVTEGHAPSSLFFFCC